ncbi:MAG: molybdopterin-synthase adenylyltransferase MoeB [Pseudomonadota bacterium]
MLTPEQSERYLRHILLREVGAQGQQRLLKTRVLIVGAGGLGAPIIQYLAAAGIGHIGIADNDTVALSNLQRQVIYKMNDVDRDKGSVAADAIKALNPDVHVDVIKAKLGEPLGRKYFPDYDLVIEGVDSFEARYALNEAAIATRTPLLSAAIGRFSGQLSLFKPYAGDLPCYRCLVPNLPDQDDIYNCEEEGVLGPLAGVMGSLAALEAIKEILGIGVGLAGSLLIYDALSLEFRRVQLPRDPECLACKGLERLIQSEADD